MWTATLSPSRYGAEECRRTPPSMSNLPLWNSFPDPYPLYDELRENHPVHFSEAWNAWLVTRYDDVVAVLRDQRRFVNAGRYTLFMEQLPDDQRAEFSAFYDYWTKPGFNLSDPPDHALVRMLTKRFFTKRAMEKIRPRVQELVDDLIDGVIEDGETDLVRDIATPLPATVIAEVLGLPTDRVGLVQADDA